MKVYYKGKHQAKGIYEVSDSKAARLLAFDEWDEAEKAPEEVLLMMSKKDLDKFAEEERGKKLDRRKSKKNMVDELK